MATKFFKCTVCGNVVVKVVDSSVVTSCCGREMVELKPGTSDGKLEYHVPVAERVDDCTIRVRIGEQPHPMSDEHHIAFIYLETEHGGQIQYLDVNTPAEVVFCGCKDKPLAAYAYCNLHGLWKTDMKDTSESCGTDKRDQGSCGARRSRGRSCCGWFAMILMSVFAMSCSAKHVDNSTVCDIEMGRYLGKWFEIARFDHSFEHGVYFPTTEYTLMPSGKIRVVNTGIKEGKRKTSIGKAKMTDTEGLLRVSFFGPFYSDYRILMVDDNYQYALVGSSSSKYLWILSRTPQMDNGDRFRVVTEASRRGYDTNKLLWMNHDDNLVQNR